MIILIKYSMLAYTSHGSLQLRIPNKKLAIIYPRPTQRTWCHSLGHRSIRDTRVYRLQFNSYKYLAYIYIYI